MTFGNLSTGTLAKLSPQLLTTRGRPIKFTSERLQQIRNLVERGESREGIADLLDVTIGSLQVTCSRLGISLRRPKVDNGVHLLRQHSPIDRNGSMLPHPIEEQSQGNSRSGPAEALVAKQQERVQTLEAGCADRGRDFAASPQAQAFRSPKISVECSNRNRPANRRATASGLAAPRRHSNCERRRVARGIDAPIRHRPRRR